MAHLLAIAFFAGLLVALAAILDQIVEAHWAEIAGALRGMPADSTEIRPTARRRAAA